MMEPQFQPPSEELLKRYLKGQCTPEEVRYILSWYEWQSMEDMDLLAEDPLAVDPEFARYAEAQLNSRLQGLQSSKGREPGKRAVVKRFYPFLTAASIIGVLLITGVLFLLKQSPKQTWTTVATARAQMKRVTLPDGTEAWINQSTTLEWASDFGSKLRLVKLKGEGRFDVIQDQAHPFIVQTENTFTRVLGTKFNVEAYPQEEEIRVSLISGKVQFVEGAAAATAAPAATGKVLATLEPGAMSTWVRNTHACMTSAISNQDVDAWVRGAIVFNNIPLKEAIGRLATRYGWDSVSWKGCSPAFLSAKVTASFPHETPEQILSGLAFTNKFHYSLKHGRLIIATAKAN